MARFRKEANISSQAIEAAIKSSQALSKKVAPIEAASAALRTPAAPKGGAGTALVQGAATAAKGVKALGGALWRGAKTVGMGSRKNVEVMGKTLPVRYRDLAGAGVLAGTAAAASQAPKMVRETRQKQQEAMAPWQGQRVYL